MKSLKVLLSALLMATSSLADEPLTNKFSNLNFRANYEPKRILGLFNVINNGVYLESKIFDEERETYVINAKMDISVNAYLRNFHFQLEMFTKYDRDGKPLKSVGIRRIKNYQMTEKMIEIANKLQNKGLLNDIETITALYYQEFDYEKGIINHVGTSYGVYDLNRNKSDLISTMMDYVNNIHNKPEKTTKKLFFYGGLHNVNITKHERSDHYRVNVNLRDEKGNAIVYGLNGLELIIDKNTFYAFPNAIIGLGRWNINIESRLKDYTQPN